MSTSDGKGSSGNQSGQSGQSGQGKRGGRKDRTAPPEPGGPGNRIAIALAYDGKGAPRVTAKGLGQVADQIIALAQAHDVPQEENRTLARLLSSLELDEQIPGDLYRVVAEVLAFAYFLRGRQPGDQRHSPEPHPPEPHPPENQDHGQEDKDVNAPSGESAISDPPPRR